MADTPFPLPRQRRETGVLTGNGGAVYGPFAEFGIFDPEDVKVWAKPAGAVAFLSVSGVAVTKTTADTYGPFTVTFPAAVPVTTKFIVRGRRLPKRDVSVLRGGSVSSMQLEAELSRTAATSQELRRDVDRSWQAPPDEATEVGFLATAPDGRALVGDAFGNLIPGLHLLDERAARMAVEGTLQAGLSTEVINRREAIAAVASLIGGNYTPLERPDFDTRQALSLASVTALRTSVRVAGYASAGDAGAALYRRVESEPAHTGKVQSLDGSWWELAEEILRPEMFGAKGDGVTDDSRAFEAMLKALSAKDGFDVYLRAKTYKLSSMAIYLTRRIRFFGVSRNTTILDFSASTTVVNAPYNAHIISVHSGNIAGTSGKATPIVLPAGTVGNYGENAGLFDLTVTCNPAVPDGIGVFFNVAANSQNLLIRNANLHGFVIAASCTQLQTRGDTVGPSGVDIGGNSNNGLYDNIKVSGTVNGDGIHLNGSDANANQFNHPDSSGNRGWGLQDKSSLGNTFVQLHTAGNAFGAYRTRPASTNRSTFFSPYAEGNQATDPNGLMFEMSNRAAIFGALGVTPDGSFPAICAANDGLVARTTFSVMDADGSVAAGSPYGRIGRGLLAMRTTTSLVYEVKNANSQSAGTYYGGVLAIQWFNTDSTVYKIGRPHFPKGISLAAGHSQEVAAGPPTDPAIASQRGQIIWNNAPSAGGKVGWVCTVSGSPGTWKPFGAIDA